MSLLDDLSDRWTPDSETGCYLWHGWTTSAGYARKMVGKKGVLVSRLVLEEAVGPPPTPKHEAAHSTLKGCRGGACINPVHLRWATHRENFYDRPAEERSERMRKIHATRTLEERSALVRKMVAAQTAEQHRARARKSAETRMARP